MRGFRVPRPWLLVALIVTLAGTPFRLAEAASDLARSAVESDRSGAIEVIDGGVGDDSGETIRAEVARDSIATPVDDIATGSSRFALPPRRDPLQLVGDPPSRSLRGPLRRHVLLQCFLC
jgi:hypothetical protein